MTIYRTIIKNKIVVVSGTIIFFYILTIVLPRDTFFALIQEDGFFEYMTAIFFLISAVTFFLLFMKIKYLFPEELRAHFNTRSRRYVFLGLAFVFFFGFGEEISWGQRIIGFSTPESIADKNIRNEFTIHNLELFSAHDATGKNKGAINKLYTMKQLFLYSFFAYLFIVPLMNRKFDYSRKLFKRFYIPIPPIWLGVLFVGNYLFYRIFRFFTDKYLEPIMNSYITEMQEFNFSLILILLPFTWFGFSGRSNKAFNDMQ